MGKVIDVRKDIFYVYFDSIMRTIEYKYNGVKNDTNWESAISQTQVWNQTLFWDELKFEIPKNPKKKLKN